MRLWVVTTLQKPYGKKVKHAAMSLLGVGRVLISLSVAIEPARG